MPDATKKREPGRRVRRYYQERPGHVVHFADAAEELGLKKEVVNAFLARLVLKRPQDGFRRHGSGQYVYVPSLLDAKPEPEPGPEPLPEGTYRPGDLFEYVGKFRGVPIVRGNDDVLWPLGDKAD